MSRIINNKDLYPNEYYFDLDDIKVDIKFKNLLELENYINDNYDSSFNIKKRFDTIFYFNDNINNKIKENFIAKQLLLLTGNLYFVRLLNRNNKVNYYEIFGLLDENILKRIEKYYDLVVNRDNGNIISVSYVGVNSNFFIIHNAINIDEINSKYLDIYREYYLDKYSIDK